MMKKYIYLDMMLPFQYHCLMSGINLLVFLYVAHKVHGTHPKPKMDGIDDRQNKQKQSLYNKLVYLYIRGEFAFLIIMIYQ